MEEFRKKLKTRSLLLTILCCAAPLLYLTLLFFTKNSSEFAQGLSMGLLTSIEVCSLIGLTEALVLLRNEKKLKEKYIQTNDERNKNIQKETASKCLAFSIYGTGIAAIVAGFFDIKICTTLTLVMVFNALVFIAVNIYYKKKM